MTAFVSVSSRFTDTEKILQDLLGKMEIASPENAIGFLTCDPETDCTDLVKRLSQQAAFPVVGESTLAFPLIGPEEEISARLTVVEKPVLRSSIRISRPIKGADPVPLVRELYEDCLAGLEGPPALFLLYCPYISGFTADRFFQEMFRLAGQVPVVGGIASDVLKVDRAAVFAGGEVFFDRMVLVALSGDIRPVFSVGSQLTVMSQYGPAVTGSRENVVLRVDDMTFCDYMRSMGFMPENPETRLNSLFQYGPIPVVLRGNVAEDDDVSEIRTVSRADVAEGSGVFSAAVPVGTRVHMGNLTKEDIAESTARAADRLLEAMGRAEAEGYRFSILMNVSCVARYFAQVGGENVENRVIAEKFGHRFPVTSFYAFGEIGATRGTSGRLYNRSHANSIVMCAF